ncbi:MAG: hypothetical protein HW373_1653 [Deltaproteobacteria bacterium]|nr:hypothetical protein [Deltaproteobacteria bacterium]
MEYIAYLHKDRKSDFGVSFPDFPGCVTAGKTLDEARRMAVEALSLFNITARKSQMEEIDRRAKKEGMTRSAYMVASALTGAKKNRPARVGR